MLMSFEKYMNEEYENVRNFENWVTYPSVFELICLLPLSIRSDLIEEPLSLDDCFI